MNSLGGGQMGRISLFFLLMICISYALVDPPLMEVHEHNIDIAPQEVFNENVLNRSERTPTLNDASQFFYIEILTLTPSINNTVSGHSDLHPQLIWLVAEKHNKTIRKEYPNGDCPDTVITRKYKPLEIIDIYADYSVNGLLKKVGDNYTYVIENQTEPLLVFNSTDFINPQEVPFKKESCFWCWLTDPILDFFLGGFFEIEKYEVALERASPYANGTINFTHRNITIVRPHLNVTIVGKFRVNYTEDRREYEKVNDSCKRVDTDPKEGFYMLIGSDSKSYEVQNDYMTLIPYSPGSFNTSANTTEDVIYSFSLLSNSNLYKFYPKMDGEYANATYLYSFEVVNDTFGTRFIVAEPVNASNFTPQENITTYAGLYVPVLQETGNHLRSPTEINNLSYNYSRVYEMRNIFYNLSNGPHLAELEFFTWYGNYSVNSSIFVRTKTNLVLSAIETQEGEVTATCYLSGREMPISGENIELKMGNQTKYAKTDSNGICTAIFLVDKSMGTINADYLGSSTQTSAHAVATYSSRKSSGLGSSLIFGSFGLFLLLGLFFAMSFLNITNIAMGFLGGGAAAKSMGGAFPGGSKGKKDKKGKDKPGDKKKGKKKKKKPKKKGFFKDKKGHILFVGGPPLEEEDEKNDFKKKKNFDDEERKKREEERKKKIKREESENDLKRLKYKDEKDKLIEAKQTSDEELLRRLKTRKRHKNYSSKLNKEIRLPQEEIILKKVEIASKNLKDKSILKEYKDNMPKIKLFISQDVYVDELMMKWFADKEAYKTRAFAYKDGLFIRESRMRDSVYLQEAIKHENYHPKSKLDYCIPPKRKIVEGFNEIMKYEDIQLDKTVPIEIKNKTKMIEGKYREWAEEQYLLMKIIGKDKYIVGHLVKGEDYLESQFDKVAGPNKYIEIFYGKKLKGSRADNLEMVYAKNHSLDEVRSVIRNRRKILSEGKYEVEGFD
jgi:hypothetical protein